MPVLRRASRDPGTGVFSQEAFLAQADKFIRDKGDQPLYFVYLRLLNLGSFNVLRGIDRGDAVLKNVARELSDAFTSSVVGRLSSGSFVAIATKNNVAEIVDKINDGLPAARGNFALELKAGYMLIRDDLTLTGTIDRARYAFDTIRYEADVHTRYYDEEMAAVYNRRLYVTEHLDDAIARGEIRAYAQPIVRVLTGLICEVEILARWESREFGFLRPDEFIPELEERRLIYKLDAEVIRLACKQWSEAAALNIEVPFGINLSRLDFEIVDIFEIVTSAMSTYGVPVEQVHIEVTESAFAHNSALLAEGIQRFRAAGFTLYLDDFGSGYSSLRVLEGTDFDVVKLDMSLVRDVEENERSRVVVADAVSMVKRLSKQTLCEGVETADQYQFLRAVGCEKAQGYFFGRPMSHEYIMAQLNETAKEHENSEDTRYLDSIGGVNLIDGTISRVQGVEAAQFVSSQPFALIEVSGERVLFLESNIAFGRLLGVKNGYNLSELARRISGDLGDLRNKILYAASEAIQKAEPQQFDFIMDAQFCTILLTHVDSCDGRDAFLLEVIGVTEYSQFNSYRQLELSLRFLYTTFKRIDLLDETSHTWNNIYLNVPRYRALKVDATPNDEILAFCNTFIHPDDRGRFLTFYDLSTIDERLEHTPTRYVAETCFTLGENDRYEDQMFMIIPLSLEGHRQYLSCMKDLDVQALSRSQVSQSDRITDAVLLTGLLEVASRKVFWKDDRLRFVGANKEFLDYFGFDDVEQVLGKTSVDLRLVETGKGLRTNELRALEGERSIGFATTVKRRDDLRMCEASTLPLSRDGRVIGLVGFIVDKGPADDEQAKADG